MIFWKKYFCFKFNQFVRNFLDGSRINENKLSIDVCDVWCCKSFYVSVVSLSINEGFFSYCGLFNFFIFKFNYEKMHLNYDIFVIQIKFVKIFKIINYYGFKRKSTNLKFAIIIKWSSRNLDFRAANSKTLIRFSIKYLWRSYWRIYLYHCWRGS